MKITRPFGAPAFYQTPSLILCLLTVLFAVGSAQSIQWKPVDPAHLALKAPVVEKDADAEAILWEVYINNNSSAGTDFIHFVRIKVFTERGKDSHSKIDIPYWKGVSIKDVAARTIKPDGSTVELKKEAIFDREILKSGKFKLKAKSFALPGIEPGVIIEYTWREVYGYITNYVKMEFQREIPAQVIRYYLKPNPNVLTPMSTATFQHAPLQFVREKDGYFRAELTNVPAFREEPHMPPEDQSKAWMLVYYPSRSRMWGNFWKTVGSQTFEENKNAMKVNDEIRRAVTEAIGDATTPEQKLERLFNYCRAKIKNVSDDASGMTSEQLQKLKENKSPADTLKRGYGNGSDINFLFGALAVAAGFEARYVVIGDRSQKFFDPNFQDTYFMDSFNMAVKVGDKWRFFDPGGSHVPFGMLRWQEEGISGLLVDATDSKFVQTPITPAEKSMKSRTAKLKLTEDGTLEGEVRIEYTGHFAMELKEDADEETPEQREKKLTDAIKKRLGAELTNVKIEGVNDLQKPFAYSYNIKVPGYAERTGKRLFFQPSFFQKGIPQLFPSSSRQHDIYFHYPWSEQDHIEISLPPGFALDNAEAPGSFNLGEGSTYEATIGVTKDMKTMIYKRNFRFTMLVLPKTEYALIKRAFDAIHEADNHVITLKQDAASAKQ